MTSQLELHILNRLDEIAGGVTSLRTAFDLHVKAQQEYDAAKLFNANLRRGRFRWAVSVVVSLASFSLALWKFL
jgi:hypothetical protein